MQLSKYIDDQEQLWDSIESEKIEKLINYINDNIDVDLFQEAKTKNCVEVFNLLKIWLLKYYNKQVLEALEYAGIDSLLFRQNLIVSLILSVTRHRSNAPLLYGAYKDTKIIEKMYEYDDKTYEIISDDLGVIPYSLAEDYFADDKEILDYVSSLGEDIKCECHRVSLYLIKKNKNFRAVTAICKKGLEKDYYHSFVLDERDNVIDLTGNLVMPKEQYYSLYSVKELNCINYQEYLEEKDESIEFDESKTLRELLRIAVYNQYNAENKALK